MSIYKCVSWNKTLICHEISTVFITPQASISSAVLLKVLVAIFNVPYFYDTNEPYLELCAFHIFSVASFCALPKYAEEKSM